MLCNQSVIHYSGVIFEEEHNIPNIRAVFDVKYTCTSRKQSRLRLGC